MSAYIVNKETIDTIVTIWIALECERSGEPMDTMRMPGTTLGRLLWEENHKSVNYRYNENTVCEPYSFEPVALPSTLDDGLPRALGAVACLMYQSCEHATWRRSRAYAVLSVLRATLEARVPRVEDCTNLRSLVPQSAGWEIDSRAELTWPLAVEHGRWRSVDPNHQPAA